MGLRVQALGFSVCVGHDFEDQPCHSQVQVTLTGMQGVAAACQSLLAGIVTVKCWHSLEYGCRLENDENKGHSK